MADFDQALNALLDNPEVMSQIAGLAEKLNLDAPPPADDTTKERPEEGPAPLPGAAQTAELGRLLHLFQTKGQIDSRADALLQALRPYLREERRRKLDRALRLVGLSQSAQQAYRLWKEGELHF